MKLSVLQWNTWYLEDVANKAQFLAAQDADVICLQELTIDPGVTDGHQVEYIAQQLGYQYYCKDIDLGSERTLLANAILSRHPIMEKKYTWINKPTGSGGFDDEHRVLIEVTLVVSGQQITVGTTHMSYSHRFEMTERKKQETDVLVAGMAKHSKRYIFTGDLNATPDSYTVSKIAEHLISADPEYTDASWTTKPFSYNGFEETELNWRLDYIFATPDIKVVNTEVLKTNYSDHLPIKTVFEI